jgi:hypothetical protein
VRVNCLPADRRRKVGVRVAADHAQHLACRVGRSRVLHAAVTRSTTFLSETLYRSIAAWTRLPDDLFQMLFLLQSIDLDPSKIAP